MTVCQGISQEFLERIFLANVGDFPLTSKEDIIYTLALNRLMEPKSELATHEWAKNVYGMKKVKDLNSSDE